MEDPFYSSKYSIDHAKRRIAEFEAEATAFSNSEPCSRVIELNPDGTQEIHKFTLTKPMPVGLSGIAFDALSSLRSALDQAGYAVAIANGKKGGGAKFPFGESLKHAEEAASARNRSKDIPKEIFDLMISFQPYKGGNNLLWALNKLCNSQKHKIIIPMCVHTGGMELAFRELTLMPGTKLPPVWDRSKNEMVVLRLKPGSKFDYYFEAAIFVAIADVEFVDGEPAVRVLHQLAGIVDSIIPAIEAEAVRIGLFS